MLAPLTMEHSTLRGSCKHSPMRDCLVVCHSIIVCSCLQEETRDIEGLSEDNVPVIRQEVVVKLHPNYCGDATLHYPSDGASRHATLPTSFFAEELNVVHPAGVEGHDGVNVVCC